MSEVEDKVKVLLGVGPRDVVNGDSDLEAAVVFPRVAAHETFTPADLDRAVEK